MVRFSSQVHVYTYISIYVSNALSVSFRMPNKIFSDQNMLDRFSVYREIRQIDHNGRVLTLHQNIYVKSRVLGAL